MNIRNKTSIRTLGQLMVRDRYYFLMTLPLILYYVIFRYLPLAGLSFAFTDFRPGGTLVNSAFVGLRWFREFFSSIYFTRVVFNTVALSVLTLIFGFPIPILFSLLLNEVRHSSFKRIIQTLSYLPHFISVVVVVGMLYNFLSPVNGIVNILIDKLGGKPINFLAEPNWFRPIYIISGVWQSFGWESIIYIAAISSIDPQLYEAATIDGANRWQMAWRVTFPSILPTMVILLILNVGKLMSVGFEKIILMYSPPTYETADVISTFVYRKGLVEARYSFGVAVDLFNSVINFLLVIGTNKFAKRLSDISLW